MGLTRRQGRRLFLFSFSLLFIYFFLSPQRVSEGSRSRGHRPMVGAGGVLCVAPPSSEGLRHKEQLCLPAVSLSGKTPGPAIVLPHRRGPRVTTETHLLSLPPHSPPISSLTPPTATADETLGSIFLLLRFLSGRP